ncbi:MAG: prohibitin family protein [Nitrospiraceae bacterium]|nr:prohibitin family protein [Nitrospiraceae bacterium]
METIPGSECRTLPSEGPRTRATGRAAAASLAVLALSLLSGCVESINPGQAAVLWTISGGTDTKTIYREGVQVIAPWNELYIYDLRTQEARLSLHVLSVNGLAIDMDSSVLYRVQGKALPTLQEKVGPDYYHVLIAPYVMSEARKIVGRFTPSQIYSSQRETIERLILEGIREKLRDYPIVVEGFLIRDVRLPRIIRVAIERKLTEEQNYQRMEYVLDVAQKTAQKRRIEAQGIAAFQKIVQSNLTQSYLTWKGIEATEKIAKSPNTKIIIIGSGKNGLPVILNAESGSGR